MADDGRDLIVRARDLALEVHAGQTRKDTERDYFEDHLAPVAAMVADTGGSPEQVAAAYLHDAAEDGGGEPMLARIGDELGPEVADLVRALSDSLVDTTDGTEKEPWEVRKVRYLHGLRDESDAVLEVSVADKTQNAESILADYDDMGEALWSRFSKDRAEYHLWYYASVYRIYAERLPGHPLTERLAEAVTSLRRSVGTVIPDLDARVDAVQRELSGAG